MEPVSMAHLYEGARSEPEAAALSPGSRQALEIVPDPCLPLFSSSMERRRARYVEIGRDGQVVADVLLAALHRIATGSSAQSPEQIWARVDQAMEASHAAYRALNNARINLRGQRYSIHDDSAPLPNSLRWFRHHGNYRGAFASMAELGNCLRGVLGVAAGLSPAERTMIARELHLRGDIWTIEHEGAVHVFGRPGSSADVILASERVPPSDTEASAP